MAAPSTIPITSAKLSRLEARQLAAAVREREARAKRAIDRKAAVLDRLEARAADFEAQIKALRVRKELALERVEAMENAILADMQERRLDKLIGIERTLALRANPARLVVEDENQIPREYMREKVISEPDKIQIKAALARQEEIAGVRLVQTVSLLRK